MKNISRLSLAIYSIILLFAGCKKEEHLDPVPTIINIAPLEAFPGEKITISGSKLNLASTKVYFEGIEGEIKARSSANIIVEVPKGANSGTINIVNTGNSVDFPYAFTVRSEPSTNKHTIKVHENQRFASVILSKHEFDLINKLGENDHIYKEILKEIYIKFEDDFDFVFGVKNNKYSVNNNPAGYALVRKNEILGTGRDLFDFSSEYGSTGKLKAILAFSSFDFDNYLILHELMHNWANFAIYTETVDYNTGKVSPDKSHWGLSGCGGALFGFDQSTLEINVDGNPNLYSFRPFDFKGFSNFELYLMGMTGPHELEPFDVLTDVVNAYDKNFRFHVEAKTRTTWDRSRIENTLGERIPDYTESQKEFKVLTLVFTLLPLSDEDLKIIDERLENVSRNYDDGDLEINFWEATQGKGSLVVGDLQESLK